MNADEARTVIKSLGEFVEVALHTEQGLMVLTFMKYDTGARDGRWHQYKYLTLASGVYEEIKGELK